MQRLKDHHPGQQHRTQHVPGVQTLLSRGAHRARRAGVMGLKGPTCIPLGASPTDVSWVPTDIIWAPVDVFWAPTDVSWIPTSVCPGELAVAHAATFFYFLLGTPLSCTRAKGMAGASVGGTGLGSSMVAVGF